MAEEGRSGGLGALAGAMRRRLSAGRWTLAAALAALVGLAAASGAPLWTAPVFFLPVLAALLLAQPDPDRQAEASGTEALGETRIEGLSAIQLAQAVPDPIVIFDAGGATIHANGAAERAFGRIAPGTPVQLRFRAPEMQALFQSIFSGAAVSGSVDYAEKVPIERVFRVTVTPTGGPSGFFVLGFRDQSEARRIDRMRSDFIANASHELRTPLASVAGFIETLRGPARDDPEARDRFLDIMQNQTARMARLIDDLLSLSRLEMKPLAGPGEEIELRGLVAGVVDALRHLAEESGVTIEKDFPAAPVTVSGSRDELIQVFENLLENACKYGRSGGRVIARIETLPREIRATIEDFGPGIAAEHIPRVTERFYRVDVESSRARKGTGLGLSIVKHILTRHGAWLTIRSQPGEGAAFTAHFPTG